MNCLKRSAPSYTENLQLLRPASDLHIYKNARCREYAQLTVVATDWLPSLEQQEDSVSTHEQRIMWNASCLCS